jgi:hypothetical protein
MGIVTAKNKKIKAGLKSAFAPLSSPVFINPAIIDPNIKVKTVFLKIQACQRALILRIPRLHEAPSRI